MDEANENPPPQPQMSTKQIWKRARALMKTHEIMDGSGHLYLKNRGEKVGKDQRKEVIAFVRSGLAAQRIVIEKQQWAVIKNQIGNTLRTIIRRGPEPEKPEPKPKKQPKPQPQPQPTLKANSRQETRQVVIQVTVKKARGNFHYPRDLPGGDL